MADDKVTIRAKVKINKDDYDRIVALLEQMEAQPLETQIDTNIEKFCKALVAQATQLEAKTNIVVPSGKIVTPGGA